MGGYMHVYICTRLDVLKLYVYVDLLMIKEIFSSTQT